MKARRIEVLFVSLSLSLFCFFDVPIVAAEAELLWFFGEYKQIL